MFSIFQLLRNAKGFWLLSFILGLLTLISGIALLAYSGWFISAAAIAGVAGTQAGLFNYLRPGAVIRLLAITRTAGRYAERLQSHYTILQLLKVLRLKCFNMLSRNFNPYAAIRAGRFNLLQQLVADIDVLDQYPLKLILPFCWAAVVVSVVTGFLMWWMPAITLPLFIGWSMLLIVLPCWQLMSASHLALNDALTQSNRREEMLEQMTGLNTLTMLGQNLTFLQQFAKTEAEIANNQKLLQRISALYSVLQQLVLIALSFLILSNTNSISPALVVACCLAVIGLNELLAPLTQAHIVYGNYRAAVSRLQQLTSQPDLVRFEDAEKAKPNNGEFYLKAVSLEWQFSRVSALSFCFNSGDIVLIRGASGCGKSSLFATIFGELKFTSGQLLTNITQISWLDQHPYIFNMTIAANLRIGNRHASDAELLEVLRLVELDDWFNRYQSDLNAYIEQHDSGLSGGELRRFALARCLLNSASLLLLDEPFAGLPAAQALRILARIKQRATDKICLVISHQLQDADDFSQIINLTV